MAQLLFAEKGKVVVVAMTRGGNWRLVTRYSPLCGCFISLEMVRKGWKEVLPMKITKGAQKKLPRIGATRPPFFCLASFFLFYGGRRGGGVRGSHGCRDNNIEE